jgi:PTH1 family peptidyl-tRNA hydrolase
MYIIAGLGNPGKKYENTRHNIGFITLDFLAERHDIKINKIKHKALVGEGRIAGQKVLLVKPQTYMNLSGESLREVMDYYKVDIEDMIVIYDDIDLDAGAVRIRKKGGPGTHNGMRSIVQHLGTDFPRIRMGIGKDRKGDLADFVLGGFSKEDREVLEPAVERAALSIECYVDEGIEKAMNKYNIKAKKEKKKKAEEPIPENNENEIKGND